MPPLTYSTAPAIPVAASDVLISIQASVVLCLSIEAFKCMVFALNGVLISSALDNKDSSDLL